MLEALLAGRPLHKVLVAHGMGVKPAVEEVLRLAREARVTVERVDRAAIERLSPTGRSQGVLAFAATKEYVTLERLLEIARKRNEAPLVVLLDGIEDPQNLGAVLRSADAAGAHGVVITARRAAGLTAAVGRASAGAIEYVAVARVANLSQAMMELAKQGVWTVGLDASAQQRHTQVDYRQPTAFVVGGEGTGLSRLVRERCDILASIPMRGHVTSLNASVSAAVALYEALRQRQAEAGPPL